MIKKISILSLALAASVLVLAQTKKPTVTTALPKNQHLSVYNQAIISGDASTAIIALNYYISEKGDNNPYADTLAMMYMQSGNYPQCYYWANKRLQVKPDDNGLLEMKGICLDKLQQPKEAIDIFEKLFKKTSNPYHAYKLMELQYGIKRLAECLATAEAAERLQYKPEYTMSYSAGEQTGRTYLQSGIYNIHALALYDLDKKAEAKTYFEKALALDSTFLLAKQNLEAVKSVLAGKESNNKEIPSPVAAPAAVKPN